MSSSHRRLLHILLRIGLLVIGSDAGTIQLVSPVLTRWRQLSLNYETAGIGILRIKFVPEPEGWMMLVAGASLLSLGARMRRR